MHNPAMNQLEQLKQYTTVVADTADYKVLAPFAVRDASTNATLILKAVQQADHAALLSATIGPHRGAATDELVDRLLVAFGIEILGAVPGRVSTEVDARLSFDIGATIARAQRIMELYEQANIDRGRVLLKIAATWEGIQAARALEHEGIHCNLTLVFSFCQAVACGEARVRLISPFVGRIVDWHKRMAGDAWDEAAHAGVNDPGVKSVTRIYNYYRKFGIDTEVMGASLRNVAQVHALAGCDLLTIGPELLAQLQASETPLVRRLDIAGAMASDLHGVTYNEAAFRWALNEDAAGTEKLSEGIRVFAADAAKLEALIEASQ
jgi:transaldolase